MRKFDNNQNKRLDYDKAGQKDILIIMIKLLGLLFFVGTLAALLIYFKTYK